jgi:hypothetical protein
MSPPLKEEEEKKSSRITADALEETGTKHRQNKSRNCHRSSKLGSVLYSNYVLKLQILFL